MDLADYKVTNSTPFKSAHTRISDLLGQMVLCGVTPELMTKGRTYPIIKNGSRGNLFQILGQSYAIDVDIIGGSIS